MTKPRISDETRKMEENKRRQLASEYCELDYSSTPTTTHDMKNIKKRNFLFAVSVAPVRL